MGREFRVGPRLGKRAINGRWLQSRAREQAVPRANALQIALDAGEQFGRVKGFHDIIVGAQSKSTSYIRFLLAGGEQNNAHRSEEHTSELQSLRHLVCRLLLEKKK